MESGCDALSLDLYDNYNPSGCHAFLIATLPPSLGPTPRLAHVSITGRLFTEDRTVWSDNEADADLLGFRHLVTAVTDIVRDEALLPASIGVYGDWGSGKSSLLRMVEQELKKDEDTLVLWFNGWLFEGFDDAKTALMGTIVDEIVSERTLKAKTTETGKKLAFKLLKRLPLLRLLNAGVRAATSFAVAGKVGAAASLTADGVALWSDFNKASQEQLDKAEQMSMDDIENAIKSDAGQSLRRGIREFRKDFAELLKETHISRLVVLIDDLDRCSPDTVIETLEAIKLFLFVPKTAFIIGADERLVRYAVRRRFPELPGEQVEVGRDYLEKLIQYPVRVPPLGRAEMETYISLLFAKKAKDVTADQFETARKTVTECNAEALFGVRFNHSTAQKICGVVPQELGDNLALAERVAPVLAAGLLGNPRQCKRFLNMLVMRMSMATSRGFTLKQRVLVKVMLLEYFHTESFRNLAEAQAKSDGKPPQLAKAEAKAKGMVRKDVSGDDEGEDGQDGARASATKSSRQKHADPEELLPAWLEDPTLSDWLRSEPSLASEDLRPYFFFARDKLLHTLGTSEQRMSPAAQELLQRLLEPGKAALKATLVSAQSLSPADAAAVLQALSERSRQEEDPGHENSALGRIIEFVKVRKELVGQAITVLNDLPENNLPPALPPQVVLIAPGEKEKALVRQLFAKWSKSSNKNLRVAAESHLKKLQGTN